MTPSASVLISSGRRAESRRFFYDLGNEMSLTKEKKSELIGKYGRGDKDTG